MMPRPTDPRDIELERELATKNDPTLDRESNRPRTRCPDCGTHIQTVYDHNAGCPSQHQTPTDIEASLTQEVNVA